MLTDSVRDWLTRPAPAHLVQGPGRTSPRPWQAGQVRSMWKKPPWDARTRPAPLQVGQVFGLEPGLAPVPVHTSQVTEVGTSTSTVLPAKASSSVISRL
jgi:hypothetical protein